MLKLGNVGTGDENRSVHRFRTGHFESGKRQMTVGVAAFGNIRPGAPPFVVVASDRMITIDDIEYEPEQTKSVVLATQTVALLAGEMEVHAVVVPAVLEGLRSNPPPGFLIKAIAESYARSLRIIDDI